MSRSQRAQTLGTSPLSLLELEIANFVFLERFGRAMLRSEHSSYNPFISHEEIRTMKKTIIGTILAVLLLTACGSTAAPKDGTPLPICWPDPCPTT
jgi:hypothetical protein